MRVLFAAAAAAVTFCRPISEGGVEWSEAKWTGIMHSYDDGHEERNERASGVGRRSSGLGGGLRRRRLQRAQLQPRLDDDLATSRFDDKNKLLFARVGNGQSVDLSSREA